MHTSLLLALLLGRCQSQVRHTVASNTCVHHCVYTYCVFLGSLPTGIYTYICMPVIYMWISPCKYTYITIFTYVWLAYIHMYIYLTIGICMPVIYMYISPCKYIYIAIFTYIWLACLHGDIYIYMTGIHIYDWHRPRRWASNSYITCMKGALGGTRVCNTYI